MGEEAGTEWFNNWATIRSFDTQTSRGSDEHWHGAAGRQGYVDKSVDYKWSTSSSGRGRDQSHGHEDRTPGDRRERDWSPRVRRDRSRSRRRRSRSKEWQGNKASTVAEHRVPAARSLAHATREELLEAIASTAAEFPPGTLDEECEVTCDLPRAKVSGLIGRNGNYIQEVRRSTGCRIHFEDARNTHEAHQTMLIIGPLLSVYNAHAMMMKRYHELEIEAQAQASAPDVDSKVQVRQLKDQLQGLTKQLEVLKGKPAGKGSGRGRI